MATSTNQNARELLKKWKAAGMAVEVRQYQLQQNAEATKRWMRKLFRASNELQKLYQQRNRLLSPHGGRKPANRKLENILPLGAGGGDEFNDEIPT